MPPPEPPPQALAEVLAQLVCNPREHLLHRWNWKSAVLSSSIRASLFFVANLRAGWRAAWGAFLVELVFRAATSGFYGAMTEAFVRVHPAWFGTLAISVLLPVLSHGLEFIIHYLRGTPELTLSIALSATFTVFSTGFNLFAMRHGALIVGEGRASILSDLRRMPRLIGAYILAVLRVARWTRRDQCL